MNTFLRISFYLLLPALFIFSSAGFAQEKKLLSGSILDPVNTQPLSLASIRNIISGNTVLSRQDGKFQLQVSKGNIISISATGFYTDTLTITDSVLALQSLIITLRNLPSTLQDVTVTARYNPYQLDSLERRRNFLKTVGEQTYGAVGRANDLGFGVAINLDHWSKREKKKRRARDLFEITEEEAYINYRWNAEVVNKYTRLSGDALNNFMQANRPTWQWLRSNSSEEDILYYINDRLRKQSSRR